MANPTTMLTWAKGDEDDYEDDGDDGQAPTGRAPHELKASYDELARAVRNLERRDGFPQGGTAIQALKAARDKAEREWRDAKAPAPLPARLGRAEGKLEKAQAALTRARLAVDNLDAEYERRREELCARVQEAESWYRWRQEQVDALHEEAADRVPRRQEGAAAGGGEVKEKIRAQLLPEVQAIMEHLEGNPEVLER